MQQKAAKHNRKMKKRLDRRRNCSNQKNRPIISATQQAKYEISERVHATPYGGVRVALEMCNQLGLPEIFNETLGGLLKAHRPYMVSDHILNIAFCHIAGGRQPEDLKILRTSESYLNMMGAERIPDATTAGDFCRRFDSKLDHHLQMMNGVNRVREAQWQAQPASFRKQALVDTDASICETQGEKKEGIGLSYNKRWGYVMQAITLGNTGEPLYLINKPGNCVSHDGIAPWIDRAIDLTERNFDSVLLRGDTDFSLTKHFDRWDERASFVFGYDAIAKLRDYVETQFNTLQDWTELHRKEKYDIKTQPRAKRPNYKEEFIELKGYRNIKLSREELAEFDYRPAKCKKTYRMIALRKTLQVKEGQQELLPETRLLFYITNLRDCPAEEVVAHANQRCNQENIFGQLKSGSGAFKMPLDTLDANWAYALCASLALSIKIWMALFSPDHATKERILKMEIPTFIQRMIAWPAQIVRKAKGIIVRFLDCGDDLIALMQIQQNLRTVKIKT